MKSLPPLSINVNVNGSVPGPTPRARRYGVRTELAAKSNGLAKKPLRKDESLKERLKADLVKLKKDRKLLRSFFKAESVAYATD